MNNLDIFIKRLQKIGFELELTGNYPWIYIDKINGKKVVEKFQANHGFTIAFYPIEHHYNKDKLKLTDIDEIFKLLRKYESLKMIRKKKILKLNK